MILKKLFSFIIFLLFFLISLFFLKNITIYPKTNEILNYSRQNNNDLEKEISNDINNFKKQYYNNFLFYKNDNIYHKNIINHNINNKINLRIQYQNLASENWCEWITNSLNEVSSNISLINFNSNDNYIQLINNKIYETIESIYPSENLYSYRMPRIAKETSGNPYFPEPDIEYSKNTVNIFGTPLKNKNTHRISRYGVYGNNSIYSSHWYYANKIYDTIKYHSVNDIFQFFKIINYENSMIQNNSFKLNNLFYQIRPETFNTNTWGNTPSGGTIKGFINLYDNSNEYFQIGVNRNRTFNDWFASNYSDYQLNNKPMSTKLGNINILNNISNIDIDFKNLIKISEKTSYFLNYEDDIHKESPKIMFTWNKELFKAFKEYYLIKKYLIRYLRQIDLNNSLNIFMINKLLIDIYEHKLNSLDLISLIENGFIINNDESNDKKEYYYILEKNNWNFDSNWNNQINNHEINKELVFKILNRSIIYEYVIPKVFSNDIWIEYQDENHLESKYKKIYDGNNSEFLEISIPAKNNQLETFDNIVKFKIKNIFMFNESNNKIIYGSKYTTNNSLDLENIFHLSNMKRNNITYDKNNQEIIFSFLFNPIKFNSPSINHDLKSLTTIDTLVSDVYGLEKEEIAKITIDALQIPYEILNKYNDIFNGLIDKTSSFNDPDIDIIEVEKYKEIADYLIKKDTYLKNKNLFDRKQINEDEFLKTKFELDKLGYFYLDFSISFPLSFYISIKDYNELISNNIIIERGKTITGNYKYWLKYSAKKHPLNINNLEDFINIDSFYSKNKIEDDLMKINSYLDNIKFEENKIKNLSFNPKLIIKNFEIENINNKYKKIIDQLIKKIKVTKEKKFNDWYKFWNKVNINFDYISLKSDLLNALINRNDEIYNFLLKNNSNLLYEKIYELEKNNELLTQKSIDIINKINNIGVIQDNVLNIKQFLNSLQEFIISENISISFNINKILENSKNNDNISKYWILNKNNINEVFYVSKQTFINELNQIIKLKTNLKLILNTQHLFSYDFENKTNEYLFENLKVSYIYKIDQQSNLLNSLSIVFDYKKTDNVSNNVLLSKDIKSIIEEVKRKIVQINKIQSSNNILFDEIKNGFFENYLITNFALDNDQYFKNIAKNILKYDINKDIKYEINWLLISIIIVVLIIIVITCIILIIKFLKKNKNKH